MRSILALAILAVPVSLVADDKKPADDLKAMVGKWTVETAELGGKDFLEPLKALKLEITADSKYTIDLGGQTDAGTVTIDASKTPKEMDIKGTDGPNKGKTI